VGISGFLEDLCKCCKQRTRKLDSQAESCEFDPRRPLQNFNDMCRYRPTMTPRALQNSSGDLVMKSFFRCYFCLASFLKIRVRLSLLKARR